MHVDETGVKQVNAATSSLDILFKSPSIARTKVLSCLFYRCLGAGLVSYTSFLSISLPDPNDSIGPVFCTPYSRPIQPLRERYVAFLSEGTVRGESNQCVIMIVTRWFAMKKKPGKK